MFILVAVIVVAGASPAWGRRGGLEESCRRAVVFTLPGVVWKDVQEFSPSGLTEALERGSAGSVSVRTNTSRTSYASGFATLGAGARLDAGRAGGAGVTVGGVDDLFATDVVLGGIEDMIVLAERAGYGARPGALGSALPPDHDLVAIGNGEFGLPVPTPLGFARYVLLAAMDDEGRVDLAAFGAELLQSAEGWPFGLRTDQESLLRAVDASLARPCASVVVDQGDLLRADRFARLTLASSENDRRRALLAADEVIAHLLRSLDFSRDLFLVVSPTAPAWLPSPHLGVAVAVGPGFAPGETLVSASTRRRGIVTLPDVAPTILAHAGIERPAAMTGRPWVSTVSRGDAVEVAIDLNDESVFVDRIKSPINTGFVVFQIFVYLLALALLAWREERGKGAGAGVGRGLEAAGLGIVAFPCATFLAGVVDAHEVGSALYVGIILAIDAALVVVASAAVSRSLDRLLVLNAATLAVLSADLIFGSRLQMNTVFGYSPIVAGRFSGAGNIAFSVLAATAIVTSALLVHRWKTKAALVFVAFLFVGTIVVDGAPQFGSDVGGVIALVPGFGITWLLLAGVRPTVRLVALTVAGALAVVALFLVIDLSRPPQARTHLAQLFERARDDGLEIVGDTLRRKAAANLRVFRSSIYTFFVPPALGVMTWLVMRPRGRWGRLAETFPRPRAGLIGGFIVAALGFAVNDSGIVIPAVVLSFLVPMALILHLTIELGDPS
ncbi:MAG TPA: hypothetical protein VM784_12080 [Actinomycetota bacterium]|nr:hypothetical protein [Actinomycetota bacterium]